MSSVRRTGSGDIFAFDEDDGAIMPVGADGYVTLGVDTYLFPLGGAADAVLESVQILTDSAIAGTFTIQTCNFPKYKNDMGSGVEDVSDWTTAGSLWVTEDPTGAYVAAVGTGWTWTVLSGAKTAGVGSSMIHIGNLGCKRVRLRAIITTAGKVRVNGHGKS